MADTHPPAKRRRHRGGGRNRRRSPAQRADTAAGPQALAAAGVTSEALAAAPARQGTTDQPLAHGEAGALADHAGAGNINAGHINAAHARSAGGKRAARRHRSRAGQGKGATAPAAKPAPGKPAHGKAAPAKAGSARPGAAHGPPRRRDTPRAPVPAKDGRITPPRIPAPAGEPMPPSRQAYAAIDLGTNNCRLLVARPAGDSFAVVDAFSRVVRLGEGLAQTGRLSDAAMDRAVAALQICADKLKRRHVYLARSVATEACRRATNGPAFIERVARETGIRLDIISAREEARLAVLGCHILLEPGNGPALVFDIGGGSTELVLIEPEAPGSLASPRILDWVSVPWGVVSLFETCGGEPADHIRLDAYAAMKARVADSFAGFAGRIAPWAAQEGARLLGTSGTVTTLASVHLELPQYDRRAVDGVIVPAEAMRALTGRLAAMTLAQRREVACIGRERADLVVAGCAILDAILDLWPARRLGIADRGIREGILRSLVGTPVPPDDPALETAP